MPDVKFSLRDICWSWTSACLQKIFKLPAMISAAPLSYRQLIFNLYVL